MASILSWQDCLAALRAGARPSSFTAAVSAASRADANAEGAPTPPPPHPTSLPRLFQTCSSRTFQLVYLRPPPALWDYISSSSAADVYDSELSLDILALFPPRFIAPPPSPTLAPANFHAAPPAPPPPPPPPPSTDADIASVSSAVLSSHALPPAAKNLTGAAWRAVFSAVADERDLTPSLVLRVLRVVHTPAVADAVLNGLFETLSAAGDDEALLEIANVATRARISDSVGSNWLKNRERGTDVVGCGAGFVAAEAEVARCFAARR